jgi:hypothetical protein
MMSDAEFEKVTQSDERLYGPRTLLLCGFAAEVQTRFKEFLKMIGLADLPLVWVAEDQADIRVGELVKFEDGFGMGQTSALPRAIIMAGITQKELHLLMSGCRQSGMQQPLWATLTPTSESWTIKDLLKELAAEHRAMQQRKQQ